jgi:hypothetical protein
LDVIFSGDESHFPLFPEVQKLRSCSNVLAALARVAPLPFASAANACVYFPISKLLMKSILWKARRRRNMGMKKVTEFEDQLRAG